jgi:hypothetical protein
LDAPKALPSHVEYPPNEGFLGEPTTEYLRPGDIVDRYGTSGGKYLSPTNTPVEMRYLPPNTNTNLYNQYKVVKPFPVQSGISAPAFGQPGMGTQYITPLPINSLIKRGIIIKF